MEFWMVHFLHKSCFCGLFLYGFGSKTANSPFVSTSLSHRYNVQGNKIILKCEIVLLVQMTMRIRVVFNCCIAMGHDSGGFLKAFSMGHIFLGIGLMLLGSSLKTSGTFSISNVDMALAMMSPAAWYFV